MREREKKKKKATTCTFINEFLSTNSDKVQIHPSVYIHMLFFFRPFIAIINLGYIYSNWCGLYGLIDSYRYDVSCLCVVCVCVSTRECARSQYRFHIWQQWQSAKFNYITSILLLLLFIEGIWFIRCFVALIFDAHDDSMNE